MGVLVFVVGTVNLSPKRPGKLFKISSGFLVLLNNLLRVPIREWKARRLHEILKETCAAPRGGGARIVTLHAKREIIHGLPENRKGCNARITCIKWYMQPVNKWLSAGCSPRRFESRPYSLFRPLLAERQGDELHLAVIIRQQEQYRLTV